MKAGIIPDGQDDGRNESPNQKLDRNWSELLQEVRVMQTGVQIIGGFLLTLPFQQRFASLSGAETVLFLGLVVLAALTNGLMLGPGSLHRRLFRHQVKDRLVRSGNAIVKVALGLIAALISGCVGLVFSVIGGQGQGWLAGGAVLLWLIAGLLVYPIVSWRRRPWPE